MRNLRELNEHRLWNAESSIYQHMDPEGDEFCGIFAITSPTSGQHLHCIVSSYDNWDHVSVSLENRCPNWPEMEHVRRTFFKPEEEAFQYHAPVAEYIDGSWPGRRSRYTLHLWRCWDKLVPKPPRHMVGGNSREEAQQLVDQRILARDILERISK